MVEPTQGVPPAKTTRDSSQNDPRKAGALNAATNLIIRAGLNGIQEALTREKAHAALRTDAQNKIYD